VQAFAIEMGIDAAIGKTEAPISHVFTARNLATPT
jgi:hypothetical protein